MKAILLMLCTFKLLDRLYQAYEMRADRDKSVLNSALAVMWALMLGLVLQSPA